MSMASLREDRLRRRSTGDGGGDGAHHAGTGHRVLDGAAQPRDRIADHVPRLRCAAPNSTPRDPPGDGAGQPVEPLPHQVVRRQVLRDRQRRRRLRGRVALEVVEVGEHLDAADAVGHGVAEMHHRRGPATFEALDEGRGPQRPGDVQR